MRIGFDARLISALGIGRYISGLLPEIAEILGGQLTVVARPAEVALVRALTGGRATVIPSKARPYRLGEQSILLLKLARARLSLVHFPHYALPLAFPGPFVATIHDLFTYRYPEIHSGFLPRLANRVLIANAAHRAAAVITPSRATAEDVVARFPSARGRITLVAEAADDRFTAQRNAAAEAAWLRYYRITPPYLFYLGQWKAYKNVPLLIEAFARVRARRPDCQLVLAGHDPRHPEVPAAANRLPAGSVVLPGRLADDAVPDLYRAAAGVVVPSLAEGFGLPVLEALACGVPVVCSDIPALRELASEAAIFCDPTSPESFADGMLAALGPRADPQWVARGIARSQSYSWRRAARETTAIYERVLGG